MDCLSGQPFLHGTHDHDVDPHLINVFVVKGLVPDVPMSQIFAGIVPFWLAMIVCIGILIAVPDIALLIPNSMIR